MRKIKTVATLMAILVIFGSCQKENVFGIRGKGETVSQTVDLRAIRGVELEFSGNVIITQGENQEIRIEAQQNIIDNIERKVVDGIWEIDFDKNVRKHDGVTIYITVPTISKLGISGSGDITCNSNFITNNLDINISGSGDIKASADASSIYTSISGSGDVSLTGLTNNQEIRISGSGNYSAFACESSDCEISISGSGDCKVNVNEQLDIKISGSGDVKYIGNPSINSSTSGSGNINSYN